MDASSLACSGQASRIVLELEKSSGWYLYVSSVCFRKPSDESFAVDEASERD